MGIRFLCHACQKKLNVKSFLAGKRGVCPKCGASINIPAVSESSDGPVDEPIDNGQSAAPVAVASRPVAKATQPTIAAPAPVATHDAIAESPDSVWYVRPPSGGQFGPANGEVMTRWLAEGRVSADSLVWREGWADWKSAAPVFPSLAGTLAAPAPIAGLVAASAPVAEDSFSLPTATSELPRSAGRTRRTNKSPLAIVVILGIACVALVVMLVMVLMSQG